MKLSLSTSMRWRISTSGGEKRTARGQPPARATFVPCWTRMPARVSAWRKSLAVPRAPAAPPTVSADSGRDSTGMKDAFQPGPPRCTSNHDSSATRLPVTRRTPDARRPPRELGEPGAVQGRVPVPLQDQISTPGGAAVEAPFAEHLRAHAKGRAEHDERGVGEGELLVRGRHQRSVRVVRVDGAAGREVDGEHAGAASVETSEGRVQAGTRARSRLQRAEQARARAAASAQAIRATTVGLTIGKDRTPGP